MEIQQTKKKKKKKRLEINLGIIYLRNFNLSKTKFS